ncbi:hypothetical protein D9756_005721 [Leucocoprinus leucothites]|uniref:Uncharacterized protein n=1 Tax=Leucocoprinus leucothites TaxID=201217 RepID=A0A8H5D8T6_9AGAR|nr:hypothetical protein D9756_005721 [Leucoagaricus leucothites]
MLIPWPEPGLESSDNRFTYESDVVTYDYDCHWPKFNLTRFPASQGRQWSVFDHTSNSRWSAWIIGGGRFADSVELPATMMPLVHEHSAALPLDNPDTEFLTPVSAFSITDELQDNQFSFLDINSTDNSLTSHMPDEANPRHTSILSCNTHYSIQPALIILQQGRLNATLLSNHSPHVGNFPKKAADAIFSQSLMNVISPDLNSPGYPGSIAFAVFVGNSWLSRSPGGQKQRGLPLLPLEKINNNLNRVVQSASKLYLSGYICDSSSAYRSLIPKFSYT